MLLCCVVPGCVGGYSILVEVGLAGPVRSDRRWRIVVRSVGGVGRMSSAVWIVVEGLLAPAVGAEVQAVGVSVVARVRHRHHTVSLPQAGQMVQSILCRG
jgi:hypothetical protein